MQKTADVEREVAEADGVVAGEGNVAAAEAAAETALAADAGGVPAEQKGFLPAEEARHAARPMFFGAEAAYLFFLGIITSMVGWIAENLVRLVSLGILDSRTHVLPFIPVYGMVVFALQIVFGDPDDMSPFGHKLFREKTAKTMVLSNVICVLTACLAVFLGELVVGNAWELISGVSLWDYSTLPLSVTQYAGLIPSLGYGIGAYLLYRFVLRPLLKLLQRKANYRAIVIVNCVLGCLMFADDIAMILQVLILQEAPVYWQIVFW